MDNHYHLVEMPKANRGRMKWFPGTYTERFNAGHRMTRRRVLREAHTITAALLPEPAPPRARLEILCSRALELRCSPQE
jgi:hypothetical protein